ncbi:MAG: hypothetical protein MZU84_06175 [Sphingobacterium sp.]|nr:hypothetical protein [Sphingobacterium sp.]
MKKTAVLLVLLPVIAVIGAVCKGGKRPSEAAYPVRIETADGIRTVVNPAFPKEGVVRYALRDELTIGGEEGKAEAVLNRPFVPQGGRPREPLRPGLGRRPIQGLRAGRPPAPDLRQGGPGPRGVRHPRLFRAGRRRPDLPPFRPAAPDDHARRRGEVPFELPAGRLLPQDGCRPARQDLLQPDADAGGGRRRGV